MKIFISCFAALMFLHPAVAGEVINWYTSQNVDTFSGTLNRIFDGVVLTATSGDINIIGDMYIENHGTIYGNLVANNDNWIRINNTGTIEGSVIAEHVMQIVTSGAGATRLNIVSNDFTVKVDGATDGVNLVDIKNLGSRSVEFSYSEIVVDDFADWQNWDALVSWSGSNTMIINNINTVQSGTYVRHVYSGTILNVLVSGEDRLYRIESVYDTNGLMLNVVRETDYQKIFDDNRGVFLENIRINNPNDKLLKAMDSAKSMGDLYNVMNSSYRFNPGILMRPIKSVNNFLVIDGIAGDDVDGVGFMPFYIASESVHNIGAHTYMNTKYNGYNFKLGLHLNKFNYEDNINDFAGVSYGLDFNFKRSIDRFAVGGNIGFNLINFDADNIYTDSEIKNNPNGHVVYGGIQSVYNYKFFDDVILSPFIGGMFQRFGVLNFSENDFNLYTGGTIKYGFKIDDVKYEYAALCGVTAQGNMFGNLKMSFDSLVDNTGLSMSVGAYNDESALTYRASINAHVLF